MDFIARPKNEIALGLSIVAVALLFFYGTLLLAEEAGFLARKGWRLDDPFTSGNVRMPGQANSVEEFSAVVALNYDGDVVCTGTLIAPDAVLTARHCIGVQFVTLGANGRSPSKVSQVLAYAAAQPGVDLALLRLKDAFDIVPLSFRTSSKISPPEAVSIVGYGHNRKAGAGFRRVLDLSLRGWGCNHATRGRYGCTPQFEMVIPRSAGADTCTGDSGGPVLEKVNGNWRVVAVTSRGVRNSVVRCGDGGVYVRVDMFTQFIQKTLRNWNSSIQSRTEKEL